MEGIDDRVVRLEIVFIPFPPGPVDDVPHRTPLVEAFEEILALFLSANETILTG